MPKKEILEESVERIAHSLPPGPDQALLLELTRIFINWNVQDTKELDEFFRYHQD